MLGKARTLLEMIKVEHSIFALPFAYVSLFLAAGGVPSLTQFLWVTLSMVGARSLAMAINRLVDVEVDRKNPRTANRALPAGLISRGETVVFILLALIVFLIAVFQLAPRVQYLWPIVIAAVAFYPYTKRFTWTSHFYLGLVYFMVPPAVWMAVTNDLSPVALLLGIAAGCWVAGFDIIYGCQDVDVDRREGLHSLPADFSIGAGLLAAKLLHAVTIVSLLAAGAVAAAGSLYYAGVILAGLLLAYENSLVKPHDLSRVNAAFFVVNGWVSILLFAFIAVDSVVW